MHRLSRYFLVAQWSSEDAEFVAHYRELPGLSGLGPTIQDAIRELRVAAEAWVEAANEKGLALPPPSSRGFEDQPQSVSVGASEPPVQQLGGVSASA
jgi:predicted RNase H-like HicB family nuclease